MLGVDDFALHCGRIYGTIPIVFPPSRPVDVLPRACPADHVLLQSRAVTRTIAVR